MATTKYNFTKEPPKGVYGHWETTDGFKAYTDKRATAVRWYKKWLENKINCK